MKRILLIALCEVMLFSFITGCNIDGPQQTSVQTENAAEPETQESINFSNDGIFRTLYSSEYTSLNYLAMSKTHELKAAANMIDGLTEYDSYGVVLPALAESWSSNENNTVWTFTIRQGVKWVDKDGNEVAEVTARDWTDTAKYVNNAHNRCAFQYMYEDTILNASEYYSQTTEIMEAENAVINGEAENIEAYFSKYGIDSAKFITFDDVGVKALDNYTLEYTMTKPVPFFLSVLSYASYLPVYGPYLEEQGADFGANNESLLFNGAYVLAEYEPNVKHIFKANPSYWDKGKVYIREYQQNYDADEVTLAPALFRRGEIGEVETINADILKNWYANPETQALLRNNKPDISNSYFYTFNFEPRFDAEYEPENWIKAVNNENFRQVFMYGLDRITALAVKDPYRPESLLNNTVTPQMFTVGAGIDFTQYGALKPFTDNNRFNEIKAVEYRDKAKAELTEAGAVFPIKILMPYNPALENCDKECQATARQLEALLGADFITIIVEAGPSAGFLSTVLRSGKYAFMKCGWGAYYADPQTWAEPFGKTGNFNFMQTDEKKILGGQPLTNKAAETQAIVEQYYGMVNAAKAETTDIAARYSAFAEAEAFLLEHAIVIPYSVDTYGYTASLRDPFSGMFAPYGLPLFRYKGVRLLEKPMNSGEFEIAYAEWKEEWASVQAAQ